MSDCKNMNDEGYMVKVSGDEQFSTSHLVHPLNLQTSVSMVSPRIPRQFDAGAIGENLLGQGTGSLDLGCSNPTCGLRSSSAQGIGSANV